MECAVRNSQLPILKCRQTLMQIKAPNLSTCHLCRIAMNISPRIFISILTMVVLLSSSCGKSERDADSAGARAPADETTTIAGRLITITANDTMKFSLTELHAKRGEPLTITLKNVGTMPKTAMGHNWILLMPDVDLNTFVAEAVQAAKTDYVPVSFKHSVLASTKLLGPRESDTVRFVAPSKPGRYPFLCAFPGHMQVGMKGVLIVEMTKYSRLDSASQQLRCCPVEGILC